MKKTVFIAPGAFLSSVITMFKSNGWTITGTEQADFLCLTGGCDVSPSLYGERTLSQTYSSPAQDKREIELFEKFKDRPKLGICRGGQLLNVLSGGKMYQHVDNHERGPHAAFDIESMQTVPVSSIHHQMMRPGTDAKVLLVARESRTRISFGLEERPTMESPDIEALYYPTTQSFCFQPHPEVGPPLCTQYFFQKIEELYDV